MLPRRENRKGLTPKNEEVRKVEEEVLFQATRHKKIGLILESRKTDIVVPMPSDWWEMVIERYEEVSEDDDYDQKNRAGAKNIAEIVKEALEEEEKRLGK